MRVKTYSYHDIETGRRFEGTISEAVEYFNVCKSSLEKWKKLVDSNAKLLEVKKTIPFQMVKRYLRQKLSEC